MRNLQASAAWARPHLSFQPILISNDEPAITAANLVKQTMLGAPFKWPWNRNEISFVCIPAALGPPAVAAAQDYVVAIADFGFLERVSLTDPAGKVTEIKIESSLALESMVQRPASITVHKNDNAGNITLRINTKPDVAYSVTLTYQRKALPMTSLASTWAPFPDEFSYIYEWGFLANLSMLLKDARFPVFRQTFTSHLLGAAEGLEELDRNLFLGNYLQIVSAQQGAQLRTQQGNAARQM